MRLARYEISPAETFWIEGSDHNVPRRPFVGEAVRPIAQLPGTSSTPLQITHIAEGVDPRRAPQALLAPGLSGPVRLFVNGIPTRAAESASGTYQTVPAAAPYLALIPPDFFHPGRNRYDLTFAKLSGKPLTTPLYAGPEAVLAPVSRRIGAWNGLVRPVLALVGAAAALLGLAASWVRRNPGLWLPVAAAAAAVGTRAWIGQPANLELLGGYRLAVDGALLGAALLCLIPIWREGGAPAHARGRIAAIGLAALWAVIAVAGLAAAWNALEILGGLWMVRLDVAYGVGATGALSAVAVTAAILTGRATFDFVRTQLDLSGVVRRQREEIASKSQALEQEMRHRTILEERQRLARDMHDGIGGQLVSLIARVRSRKVGIDQVERELVGGLAELRLVVDSLDAAGDTLAEAVAVFRSRVQPQADAAGMALVWTQEGDLDVTADDPRWVLNVYRLLQEAVSNSVAHSGADRLEVVVRREPDGIRIEASDNGKGVGKAREGGRGLANMTYRARQLGGELEIGPDAEGRGTRVGVSLPLPGALPRLQSSGEIKPS